LPGAGFSIASEASSISFHFEVPLRIDDDEDGDDGDDGEGEEDDHNDAGERARAGEKRARM
jgi:hypothetical protein